MDTQPHNQIIEAMAWLFKLLLKALLVLVGIAAIAGGGWYGYHYWTYELPTSQVRIEAKYAPYEPEKMPETPRDAEADHPIDLLAEDADEQLMRRAKRMQEAARATFAEAQAHGLCLKGEPIQISIANDSNRTIEFVQFRLVAKRPGHSTNLVEDMGNLNSDRILRPNEEAVLCRQAPSLSLPFSSADLEWSARIDSVRFSH